MPTINNLTATLTVVVMTAALLPSHSFAEGYLSGSEVVSVGLGSAGVAVAGRLSVKPDSSRVALIPGPLPMENQIQRFLGGKYYQGKTNFLDNSFGSALTPVATGLLLLAADISWAQGDRSKTTLQDLYLYSTGLMATAGLTDLTKGIVARPRPHVLTHSDGATNGPGTGNGYNRQSFFSGHTSSSFFAAAFANKRFRSIMRSELSASDYDDWSWAPPVLLYGWASFVGWSRIHAYKHFISDVIAGALVGYLIAELFYSFGDDAFELNDNSQPATVINITFRF